jgi:hypothetical protein
MVVARVLILPINVPSVFERMFRFGKKVGTVLKDEGNTFMQVLYECINIL